MAFTKALYYPRIEVPDEGWLKTAILYWDEVKTIVPASMPEPYSGGAAREMFDAGVLSPLHVHPGMACVERLAEKVYEYLGSGEADGVLVEGGRHPTDLIHPEKLPELREFVRMHPAKLPYAIEAKLDRLMDGREGEWVRVDRPFARFYMTLLATELASTQGIALLTDLPASDRLAVNVRLDGKLGIPNLRLGDPHWLRAPVPGGRDTSGWSSGRTPSPAQSPSPTVPPAATPQYGSLPCSVTVPAPPPRCRFNSVTGWRIFVWRFGDYCTGADICTAAG